MKSLVVIIALAAPAFAAPHPLDPLSAAEYAKAVEILSKAGKLKSEVLFPNMALNEPPKAEVLAWKAGEPYRREAFASLYDRKAGKAYEAVVDLVKGTVASWKALPGVQPPVMFSEFEELPKVVAADPRWQKAMARRGLTDMSEVAIDIWAYGSPVEPKAKARLLRALAYFRGKGKNFYARPIEGVSAVLDADARKVLEVIDGDLFPLPPNASELDAASLAPARAALKPLTIAQPEGASYTLDGHEVRWDRWRFRWSMHPREGLVLHQVAYDDNGTVRPVMYRASLSEMMVPYGHPDGNWTWRAAFDEGEYGIGRYSGGLKRGVEVPENAQLLDADFVDDFGKPLLNKEVVALYERDGGMLWKHYDMYKGGQYGRRGRELVIGFVTTISNYDYGMSWVFRQDGTLRLEADLTGIMLAKGVKEAAEGAHAHEGTDARHAHLVAPNVAAPHHQHFFNFRLDLDVDGADGNRAWELDSRALPPGPSNPALNAFEMTETPIASERESARDLSFAAQRKWKVTGTRRNGLGGASGYLLIPGENAPPYLSPGSPLLTRGGFVSRPVWFTRYAEGEVFAAGSYPNLRASSDGLPEWTKAGRSLDGVDLVLWHNVCVTHAPRPEEWPVMAVHKTGFSLMPAGFFDRNPALDLPGGE
ncbi:MAG: primary-amine oxidase [Elusimicrobia bacterium]|nr:primary-amine oxidase [Elusimicrobiota bacterium]